MAERYEYDPYGSATVLTAAWGATAAGTAPAAGWLYLHQGGRRDDRTGWYGFRRRDLIPTEGRWETRPEGAALV